MSYTFQREGKLFLVSDSTAYALNTLSSYSLSQTFQEFRFNEGTLHVPLLVDSRGTDSLSVVAFSLDVYLTPEILGIFHFLGFDKDVTTGDYKLSSHTEPRNFDLYIQYLTGRTIKIENALFSTCNITLGKNIIQLRLSGEASILLDSSLPSLDYVYQSQNFYFGPVEQTLVSRGLLNATIDITRDIYWLNDRVLTDQLYYPKNAVIDSYDINFNVNTYALDNNDFSAYTGELLLEKSGFSIFAPSVYVTERIGYDEAILTRSYDMQQTPIQLEQTTISG